MNYDDVFENLERANAQIDVWIDEEEYCKVINSCEINKDLKINKEDDKTLYEILEDAFSDESCTANKNHEWLSILNHSTCPISAICNIPQSGDRIVLASPDYDIWGRFFWAKLLRARIQKKGTDCYYQRLDDVIIYLERHLPVFDLTNPLSSLLATIYLLEMAASGVDVDQQSFAERTRRILKTAFRDHQYKKYINHRDFYDLLARYNNGVGFFHRGFYRKAVLEFNFIISKLDDFYSNPKDMNPKTPDRFEKFVHKRLGLQLLYLPAVLYRADIQLKLQLAYHAQHCISSYLRLREPSPYKQARANLIKAEAYQLMGRRDKAWQELSKAYEFAVEGSGYHGCGEYVRSFSSGPGEKWANLRGRLKNLLIAGHLEYLKKSWQGMDISALKKYLQDLNTFFNEHKVSTERQASDRTGYLEQIAEYLELLSRMGNDRSEIVEEIAKEMFFKNREDVLFPGENSYPCPCKEKGIDLRRLDSAHYDAFSENIRKFFKKLAKNDSVLRTDQKDFLNRLITLEKSDRENLSWRIRKLDLEADQSHFENWCSNCVPSENAFSGLLTCKNKSHGEEPNSLYARDYEKIMNHWDDHFLKHMRDVSFHEPRSRALHFLGLQRWNSTSPAQGQSLGGGYVIYHTTKTGKVDLGIAIDPGFDFVRNLFHVGFSLADIDIVLMSHAHLDHVRDFESMITLLLELYKRTEKNIKRKLHTIMTLGVYKRLEYLIESPGLREYIEPYIIDIEKELNLEFMDECEIEFVEVGEITSSKYTENRFRPFLPHDEEREISLKIIPTKAYHNDFSEYSDSYGFNIIIKDSEFGINHTFGYTGDTSWYPHIMEQFKDSDALLVHLGSLIDREKPENKKFQYYKTHKKCFELAKDKNHPYLMGMLHFLTEINEWNEQNGKKPLVLISEFGEELRGKIRLDFIDRLKKTYKENLNVLPVDVGLDVLLAENKSEEDKGDSSSVKNDDAKVWCVQCEEFTQLDEAAFEHYGHDEALFCVCKTCQKTSPINVLQDRLRTLYEVGRRLETYSQENE